MSKKVNYPFKNVPMPEAVFLGELRRIRKLQNLTQEQLAIATGLSHKTISFVETGKYVTPESLGEIAKVLGIQITIETTTNFYINQVKTFHNGKTEPIIKTTI